MEEIIAKKKSSLLASYIVLIVFGAIFSVFGVSALVFAPNKILGVTLLLIGLILLGGGIAWTVVIARLPKIYVTYKDGKLVLYNGLVCSPSEVDYCNASTFGLDGAIFNYGKLTLSINHVEYKFKFVVSVTKAASIINNLKSQYTAIENAQREIAARNAAEPTQMTEK